MLICALPKFNTNENFFYRQLKPSVPETLIGLKNSSTVIFKKRNLNWVQKNELLISEFLKQLSIALFFVHVLLKWYISHLDKV